MRGKIILCRCEDVTLKDVEESIARGYDDIEEVKRYTGFGTGPCQGKECLSVVALALAERSGATATAVQPFTARPPLAPTPLKHFAVATEALCGHSSPPRDRTPGPAAEPRDHVGDSAGPAAPGAAPAGPSPGVSETRRGAISRPADSLGGAPEPAAEPAAAEPAAPARAAPATAAPDHGDIATAKPGAPVPERAEVVIIGAGIMGLSIAYHLARRGLTDQVILERSYLAYGASGRNGGGVRQQWSTELNIRLMQDSVAHCRRFAKELGVNVWFRQGGYLFLARNQGEIERLQRNIDLQHRCGLSTRMIDVAEISAMVPELDTAGILGAAFNPADGILFPWPFLWGYGQRAVSMGARLYTFTGARAIDVGRDGYYTVHTQRGAVRTKRLINCAGAWSGDVARLVGVAVPTYPIRHEICSSEPLKPFLRPMVSELATGLYFSQSMRGEIVGGVSLPGEQTTISMGSRMRFLSRYAQRLVELMPVLGDVKVLRQWAGPYDMSPDGNPIVGEPDERPGFFLACGFVGHGFMMAPTVGDIYAAWIANGERHEIFDRWRLSRFTDGSAADADREDFNIG